MTIKAVNVLVLNTEKNILCVHRASTDNFKPNMWALPGGSIEINESHKQALQREAKEEANACISNISEEPIIKTLVPFYNFSLELFVYTANVDNESSLHTNTPDISEVAWKSATELLESLSYHQYPAEEIKKLELYFKQQAI